jgi:hypothetical protein
MMDSTTAKKGKRWEWLLWWQIDPAEVGEQVANYKSLRLWKSARGISVLCLLFSVVATSGMAAAGVIRASAYIDVGLFAVLALFIYLGHRWAMIGAMVIWTLEKSDIIFGGLGGTLSHAPNPVVQIIWWCLYMHAFYLAFRVEQARRQNTSAVTPVPEQKP